MPSPAGIVAIRGNLGSAGPCSKNEGVLPQRASDAYCLSMGKGFRSNDRNRSRPNAVCWSFVPCLFVSGCLPIVGAAGQKESLA